MTYAPSTSFADGLAPRGTASTGARSPRAAREAQGHDDDVARLNLARVNAKWFREYLAYDPADDLPKIDVPVLALTGTKDLQVDPADLAVVADRAAGPVETHLVEDLTHSLRRQAGAPSLSRYKQEVREPVDAEVVAIVQGWVKRYIV